MDKIFITGGSGLLGSNISKISTEKYDVFAAYNKNKVSIRNVNFIQMDVTKKEDIKKIEQIRPNLIIHCAALVKLDYCQQHPNEAYKQHVVASAYIAEIAKKIGSHLIFISTDSVFNGEKGNYSESDSVNPVNVYGATKLEAENKILSIYPSACIIRTNIYGWNKLSKFSLAEWMLDVLIHERELPGFYDVFFSPILVNDLAKILFKLQEIRHEGLIHIAGSESCSKLDFAYKIAEVFNLNKELIKPISIDNADIKTKRGFDLSLNVSKAVAIFKNNLPTIEEGIREMKRLRDEGYVDELKL